MRFLLGKRCLIAEHCCTLVKADAQASIQYVAQYPDGTSIRTLETKTQFLRRPFQFSVNEVFRMKAEHFSFKMKVLEIGKLAKQSQKTPFCSVGEGEALSYCSLWAALQGVP